MFFDSLNLLERFYPMVRPLAFFKVDDHAGKIFRDGHDFGKVEEFDIFSRSAKEYRLNFFEMRQTPEWVEKFYIRTGRLLTLEDVRIAFRPSCEMFLAAFVDDVQQINDAHLLVETSPCNWQAHFCLSRPCSASEVLLIHRYLSAVFSGDKGAHAADQARRLPVTFLRSFVQDRDALDVDFIVRQLRKKPALSNKSSKQSLTISPKVLHEIWERKLKQAEGDKSCADFKMAIYLLNKDYSFEDTCEAISLVSENLEFRKGRWSEEYIYRTVKNADSLLLDQ